MRRREEVTLERVENDKSKKKGGNGGTKTVERGKGGREGN